MKVIQLLPFFFFWNKKKSWFDWTSDSLRARSNAVAQIFPKLAYVLSDIIVLVGRDPMFNTRYVKRCIEFAATANAGVSNVRRPALILVANKLPNSECDFDVNHATQVFYNAVKDIKMEDSFFHYFSSVKCLYLNYREHEPMTTPSGEKIYPGQEQHEQQIEKLKVLIDFYINKFLK